MSFDIFFIDPYEDVTSCNGAKNKEATGNQNIQRWNGLWNNVVNQARFVKYIFCNFLIVSIPIPSFSLEGTLYLFHMEQRVLQR